MLSQAPDPWTELRYIPGENYDIKIAEIQLALNDLPKQGLSDDEEDSERKRLRAERDRLTELNKHARPDRLEEVETGETVGQYWACLDYEGKRKMMLDNVKFYSAMVDVADVVEKVPMMRMESRLFKPPYEWRESPVTAPI